MTVHESVYALTGPQLSKHSADIIIVVVVKVAVLDDREYG